MRKQEDNMVYYHGAFLRTAILIMAGLLLAGCSTGHSTSSTPQDNDGGGTGDSLVIFGVQPAGATAGASVAITGTGFGTSQGAVQFGSVDASISSWSDSAIRAIVPDVSAGSMTVHIVAGTRTGAVDFIVMPSIAEISTAHVRIGDTLLITGTGFGTTQGGGSVNYAGTLLPIMSWSNNHVTAAIGNLTHAAQGLMTVSVNDIISNGITLTVHPSIMSVSPDTAERGDAVTVEGNLFGPLQGSSTITFAGSAATVTSWSDTLIKVHIPDTAVKGDVVVTVNDIPSFGRGFTVTRVFHSINQPTGISMDDAGMMYVANYSDGTIIQVMPGGITQTTVYKGLSHPMGVYYKAPTDLFVACEGDGTIQKITLGTRVTGYTYAAGFSMPAGITFDDAGNMYVTNMGSNSISRLDLDHSLTTFATGLNKPMGIVFTGPAGLKSFKVVNNGSGSIFTVDGTGVVYSFVTGLNSPHFIISDKSYNIFVTNGNSDIIEITPSKIAFTYTTDLSDPYGLVMDTSGLVYAANYGTNSISKIDTAYRTYAQGFTRPWGIAFSASGTLFVTNLGPESACGGSISMVTTDGRVLPFVETFARSACNSDPSSSPCGTEPMDIKTGFQKNLFVSMYNTRGASTISEVTYDGEAHLFGSCAEYASLGAYSCIAFNPSIEKLYVSDTQNGKLFTMTSSGAALYPFAGGFNLPTGITVDSSGMVYVANAGNGTISQTTTAGTLTMTYASGFSQPSGIAFNRAGDLYVSNYGSNSVSLVSQDGRVSTFITGITHPNGIAMDNQGYMYVASESAGVVYKLIHMAHTYAPGLTAPKGIAKGPDGLIYITDSENDSIYRLESSGVLTFFTTAAVAPSWMIFDNQGSLFVSDFTQSSVLVLSDGVWHTFASGLNGPSGIVYDAFSNLWYTANYLNNTLSVINSTGNASTFVVGLAGPMGIAFSSPGNLYVANSSNGTIAKVVQGSGVTIFASGFGMPVGLALDPAGYLYAADQNADAVFILNSTGVVVPFARVSSPYGLAFDGLGNLFVSDTLHQQIQEIVLQ